MALVFDITSEYAMFRKFYTTTSSISYPFPPPTAIGGLIAAIIGEENEADKKAHFASYWNILYGNRIAISLKSKIQWYTTSINFWNYKAPKKAIHNIIKHQFVKNPIYRIFVEGAIEEKLKPYLESGQFIFTPYLGTAYSLAKINYIGSFTPKKIEKEKVSIKSLIPVDFKPDINLKETQGIFKDIVPLQMDSERNLVRSITVFYPANVENGIIVENPEKVGAVCVGEDNIVWLPKWEKEPSKKIT